MLPKKGPAFLIGIMGKKSKGPAKDPWSSKDDDEEESTGDEGVVKDGLTHDFLEAVHAKDAAGVYDALEAIIHHCVDEDKPSEEEGEDEDEKY